MKIREQARKDLAEILLQAATLDEETCPRNAYIADRMRARGYTITTITLLDTARDLGFPVIGNRIYGLDD